MITTKLTGRLGNLILEIFNLFKYAQTKDISFSDIFLNKDYNATACGHGKYNDLKFFKTDNYIERNKEFFSNIIDVFIDQNLYNARINTLKQIDFIEAYNSNAISDNVYLINNPCNSTYINKNKFESLKLFRTLFKNDRLIEKNSRIYNDINERIAIHIRRTDYADWNNGKCLLSKEKINETINQYIDNGHKKFIVFSDDIEWCKKNVNNNYDIVFHNPQEYDYNDMILMSLCKDIFANGGHSSFSKCANLLRQSYKNNI